MKIGWRKFTFSGAVFVVLAFGLYGGAIPRFEYLQGFVDKFIEACVWIASIYVVGNVSKIAAVGIKNGISKVGEAINGKLNGKK